uniref:Neural cell adhesion molecule L1-like protein n=1 Tax=Sphenodon punctatus TaxID=8508 RepID=A0A8D0HGG8_SPHPU
VAKLVCPRGFFSYLFFFLPAAVSQLPTITNQSTTQVAYPFDEDFTFKCEAKGNPQPTFNWTKDGKPFNPLSDPRISTSSNTGTFVIKNHGDIRPFQGKYYCYASNDLGTVMSEEIELIVPIIPKFPKEKIEPMEVEYGDSIVLHCNPPDGIPPLHIYWMNIDLQHIPQDARVSMSLQGDLYFANVEENDSRNDYCCFAAFPRLRTIVQKMPMTLMVTRSKHDNDSSSSNASKANFIKERKPKMLIPPESSSTRSSVTVIKGGILLLECIAEGLPTPTLSWIKVSNDLPQDRTVKENYEKILKIEDVSTADEGTYQCTASNALGTTKHEFRVHVEEPPRWVKKPESGVFSVGSVLLLLCEAIGNPEPTIKWKINGKPVDSKGVFSPREISLVNLQLHDSAVYQCEATNKHGTILATANINVLNIPPLILTPDGENYATVLGYPGFLHCQVFASPTVLKDTQSLEGLPYYVHENGTLEIRETKKEDSGSYICWVTNSVGKSAITANLGIRDATRLIVTPKNPQVLKSHSVLLKCQSEYDSHLKESFKLSWRKDGGELQINSTDDNRIIAEMDTLFISSVKLEDQGTYTCVASTSLDSVTADSQLIVLDVPDPAEDLHLSENQNTSVRLSWKTGSSHNSPINESIVEFEENRWEPGKWQELTRVPGNNTTIVLPLAPYINYQFRVISINAVGRSQPSRPTERYETPPSAPDKNPENIRVEASEPHEMVMKWEPLKPMERNGPGLEYKVSWRRQGVETDWNEELVKKHSLTLRNTPTFVPYDIKIQTVNNLGSGPEPNVTTGYSGEDFPDAALSKPEVEVMDSTLVKALWSEIPKDRVRGHLRGYKVSWWKTGSMLDGKRHHQDKHSLTFMGDRNYGMIPGLEPFSEYHLTVLAFNSKGPGPESLPAVFQTPEGGKKTESRGLRELNQPYAGMYGGISTQGWFIGLMCAVALLTLLLLTVCFVKRNKGGKYSVKEKEDLHPDPEAQSIKDEIFGEYSDSDEKPLKGSLPSLNTEIKTTESADSLVDYGEGDHGLFNEDGSFIGAYTGSKEKASVESIGSSTATFPLHA